MRHPLARILVLIASTSVTNAQTLYEFQSDSPRDRPPLVSNVVVNANDSPLVRAAKRNVAAREAYSQQLLAEKRRERYTRAPQIAMVSSGAGPGASELAAREERRRIVQILRGLAPAELPKTARAQTPAGRRVEQAPRPAMTQATRPRVVDSPLVQAAKRTIAWRRGVRSYGYVIDNVTVRQATRGLTTSSGAAPVPDYTTPEVAALPAEAAEPAKAPGVDRVTLERRAAEIRSEMERHLHDEEQGPYGTSEDETARRLNELDRERRDLDAKLQGRPPQAPR